jgi:hypothetical protein
MTRWFMQCLIATAILGVVFEVSHALWHPGLALHEYAPSVVAWTIIVAMAALWATADYFWRTRT